jgi:hypothetical protein
MRVPVAEEAEEAVVAAGVDRVEAALAQVEVAPEQAPAREPALAQVEAVVVVAAGALALEQALAQEEVALEPERAQAADQGQVLARQPGPGLELVA